MDWVGLRSKVVRAVGKYRYVLLILLLGICLMLLPDFTAKEEKAEPAELLEQKSTTIAQELETILSQVKGAGKVSVMLTMEKGEHVQYQTDDSYTGSESQKHDTVIITDADRGQSGLIQRVDAPKYRGAVVVCKGAQSPMVRLAILEAVSKVTGLDSSQISILEMK